MESGKGQYKEKGWNAFYATTGKNTEKAAVPASIASIRIDLSDSENPKPKYYGKLLLE